ncbi:MAG: S8 family serine peptidase [Candidatus Latescibacterota bacterium]|nr:MAG: S8 family serine peptidase [Candidatus Latescibacterota bacterium]
MKELRRTVFERHMPVAPPTRCQNRKRKKPDRGAARSWAARPALRLSILAACVGIATWCHPALASSGKANRPPGLDNPALREGGQDYLPGVIVVKFAEHVAQEGSAKPTGSQELDRLLQAHAVSRVARVAPGLAGPRKPGRTDLSRVYMLYFESGKDAKEVARDFASSWDVVYAEPQFIYRLAATANDPLYALEQSSYFDQMQLPAAFDETRGEDGNVVVAIVDGGSEWQHADLAANVWSNPGEVLNGVDDDGNGFVDDVRGWNFADASNDPTGLVQTPGSAGHGTHVAGIACAVTNNGTGVSGASWNARFMPVCVSHPSVDGAVTYGYQGILYAAQNGADIINCSWGGPGNPSSFEQEVVDFAYESGAVLVAAAGNNASSDGYYPAAYRNVLSVANVNDSDQKIFSSNYGTWVDVAAQGTRIHSTFRNGDYTDLNGTSMASPHAAAACALVKTKFPTYTPDQVRERVRVTSDNIDGVNPSYAGLLGHGRINAFQALTATTPAIRIREVDVMTSDGDRIVEPGETVTLELVVINHLDAATGADFTLSENSGYVTVTSGSASIASIGTAEEVTLTPLTLDVSASAPLNHTVGFTLDISTSGPAYSDRDHFELRVLPIVANHSANRVTTSVTSVGKLGFAEVAGGNGEDGVGFIYDGSPNLLYEGALMIGNGVTTTSNAARGPNPQIQDADFVTAENGVPLITSPMSPYDEFGVATFTDAGATTPLALHVTQESWQMRAAPYQDFIVLEYTVRNDGAGNVNGLYVGWYFDWDLDGATFESNHTGYDAGRGLGYVYDAGAGPDDYAGVTTLTAPGTTSYRGIWNDENLASNPSWGVYDGFTDAEKWEALSGGIVNATSGPADISQVIATGPFDIAPGQSIHVAFAIVGGSDLANLQAHADAAQSLWDNPVDSDERVYVPLGMRLAQNVPNPFNPATSIAFELPRASAVELEVYSVRGRLVRTLLSERREAGVHRIFWDGLDARGERAPSGTYIYRLRVDGQALTRKMQLLK